MGDRKLVKIFHEDGNVLDFIVPNACIMVGHVIGYEDTWSKTVMFERKIMPGDAVQILNIQGDIHAELIAEVHNLEDKYHEQVKNFIETLKGSK